MRLNPNENKPPRNIKPLIFEYGITALIILALSALSLLFIHLVPIRSDDIASITYSAGKEITYSRSFLLYSFLYSLILTVVELATLFFVHPSKIKPDIGKRGKYLIAMITLSLFGILAYVVIALLLSSWGMDIYLVSVIASLLVGIYLVLIYKLYMEKKSLSNDLFWEIFRFAIVGLVAAVFDFLVCFLFQFIIFKDNTDWYVTLISTAMGFVVGVTINYLLSTYMVYKAAKSNFSKSFKGIVTFLVLSTIGLFIGMGLQYLLYDVLYVKVGASFFSYPIDFVIRTLVVMVYNYISRKLIIYR